MLHSRRESQELLFDVRLPVFLDERGRDAGIDDAIEEDSRSHVDAVLPTQLDLELQIVRNLVAGVAFARGD